MVVGYLASPQAAVKRAERRDQRNERRHKKEGSRYQEERVGTRAEKEVIQRREMKKKQMQKGGMAEKRVGP